MSDKEIAKKSNSSIALPDDLILASAGKGLQNISNDDVTIPRLAIIQSGSPQRKKKDEKYIDGADEGMIFNTVTNELYKDSLEVVPCGYRKTYVEWVPREKGGGLVAVHDLKPEKATTDPKTRKTYLGENQIVDTAEHFVLVKTSEGYAPAVLTMTSSNLGVSRKWNTLLKMKKINIKGQMVEPPSFLYMFKLATINAENDLGSWYKYKLDEIGQVSSKDVFSQAESLSDSINTGKVKASEPVDTETTTNTEVNNSKAPW